MINGGFVVGDNQQVDQSAGSELSNAQRMLRQVMLRAERHAAWVRGLDRAIPASLTAAGLTALAVVVIRSAFPAAAPFMPYVITLPLLVGLLAVVVGWLRSRGSITRLQIGAQLDQDVQGHGLVMALTATTTMTETGFEGATTRGDLMSAANQPDARWFEQLAPALRQWRPRPMADQTVKGWSRFGLVYAVALVLLLVPQQYPEPEHTVDWTAIFSPSHQSVDRAAEHGLLDQKQHDAYQERIQRLEQDAEQHGLTARVWQGLDRVGQELNQRAHQANMHLAQSIAEADAAAGELSRQQPLHRQRQQALQASLAEFAQAAPEMLPALQDLPPSQQAAMAALLGQLSSEQQRALEQAGWDQLAQAQAAGRAQQPSQQELAEAAQKLRERLKECQGNCQALGQPKLALAACQIPGAGRIQRGPGHALLQMTQRTQGDAEQFEALQQGLQHNTEASSVLAQQTREADRAVEADLALERGELRDIAPAAADSRRTSVAPKHRAVVARFFQQETSGSADVASPVDNAAMIP